LAAERGSGVFEGKYRFFRIDWPNRGFEGQHQRVRCRGLITGVDPGAAGIDTVVDKNRLVVSS
jgi:hypothetical protein